MDELVKLIYKNTAGKNWILFCVVLGIVNTGVFYLVNGKPWCFSTKGHDPFFLGMEILLTALAVTRILVAVDITYLLQVWPITGDLAIFFNARTRDTHARLQLRKVKHHQIFLVQNLATEITLGNNKDVNIEIRRIHSELYYAHLNGHLFDVVLRKNVFTDEHMPIYFVQTHIWHHYYKDKNDKLYFWCNFVFFGGIALFCGYFIYTVLGAIVPFLMTSFIIRYFYENNHSTN